MIEYNCCGLHHSSYCPEARGVPCGTRIAFRLDPNGVNEEKLREIIRLEKTVVDDLAKQKAIFPKKKKLFGTEIRQIFLDEFLGDSEDQ